jgi:hypothetical protein
MLEFFLLMLKCLSSDGVQASLNIKTGGVPNDSVALKALVQSVSHNVLGHELSSNDELGCIEEIPDVTIMSLTGDLSNIVRMFAERHIYPEIVDLAGLELQRSSHGLDLGIVRRYD